MTMPLAPSFMWLRCIKCLKLFARLEPRQGFVMTRCSECQK